MDARKIIKAIRAPNYKGAGLFFKKIYLKYL
nr:MAG TPA: 50S ribosomal protein L2 [Caudoviricetes sp.]